MSCSVLSDLTIFDLLALLVAALSAVYARWSWSEAKRANTISLLGHKKSIYDGFFHLKMHMTSKRRFAEPGEVSKFYYHAQNARIYLPADLASVIEKYFDACFWIADTHKRDGGLTNENSSDFEPHLKTIDDLGPKIDEKFLELLQAAGT